METKAKILIVDDERVLAGTMAEFLASEGYEVATAHDAAGALNEVSRFEPEIVLCDIQLPGTSGLQLLKKIEEVRPGVSVVMITAYATVESAIAAFHSGARDYLIKPVQFDDLTARLEHILQFRQISRENAVLKRKINRRAMHQPGIEALVGSSVVMQRLKGWIMRVGPARSNVLITGESGTGKELAARALHDLGDAPEAPFLAINCAAIPSELLENQLFGHIKGAFTGADRDRDGLFAAAGSGSVFLDEIGELAIGLQSKLLRVIENREILPVGANRPVKVHARVIAATNKDLTEEAKAGRFRPDLFYRLNVVTVPMPPLAARREDIPELARFLVQKHADRMGKLIEGISVGALERLSRRDWPGNVRELDNQLERAVILSDGGVISESDLFHTLGAWDVASTNQPPAQIGMVDPVDDLRDAMREFEKNHLKRILTECGDDRRKAAARLGLGLSSLYAKIKEHTLSG